MEDLERALPEDIDPVPEYAVPPPSYTAPPAGTVEPVRLDTFLTLELLCLVVRCIKAALKITRPGGDGRACSEKLLRIPEILEKYLSSVVVAEEMEKGQVMTVKLAKQCIYEIRHFGERVKRIVRMPLQGARLDEEMELDRYVNSSCTLQ